MTDLRRKAASALVFVVALAISTALHGGAAAPYLAWSWVNRDLDTPGDGGPEDGKVGDGGGELAAPAAPVQVAVYEAPTSSRGPSRKAAAATPTTTEPTEYRVLNRDDTTGEGTDPDGDAKKEGVSGRPPRGKKKPCEPIEEIVKVDDTKWRVERGLLDWYATHLRELDKQAGVAAHKDADGKRDGARLYLPRCSVLKQAGFKNRDIIRSVNGRKVYTIPQAVATYLKLRDNKTVTVELTRRDGTDHTFKYKLK